MPNSTATCNSFKVEILKGIHDFTTTTGDTFKCALYTSSASLGASTTAYSTTYEITGTGYTPGGFAWTAAQNVTPFISGTTVCLSWSVSPTWASASFTANAALIYNSTKANRAVMALFFGIDRVANNQTFTVTLPLDQAGQAVLQLI